MALCPPLFLVDNVHAGDVLMLVACCPSVLVPKMILMMAFCSPLDCVDRVHAGHMLMLMATALPIDHVDCVHGGNVC